MVPIYYRIQDVRFYLIVSINTGNSDNELHNLRYLSLLRNDMIISRLPAVDITRRIIIYE